MPGWTNADNKFGLTPFIVGQSIGDGCNYTSIQTAIDDCFAAGGGVVGIRPSTVTYVENLTLRAGVDLKAFDVDGRMPPGAAKVAIQGNHSYTVAGGFGIQLNEGISFDSAIGDTFTMLASGGGQAFLIIKNCGVTANTVPGQRICLFQDDGASPGCQFTAYGSAIASSSHCFECTGTGAGNVVFNNSTAGSQTGSILQLSTGSGSITGEYSEFNGSYICNFNTINGSANFSFSKLTSSNETVLYNLAGGTAAIIHCTISSGAISGNWIDGAAGQLSFGNTVITNVQGIGPTIAIIKENWQPYGEASISGPGSARGTASFDSAQFSVVDGFVQALPAGIFPWVDQPISTTVVSNQGNFVTGALVTLTLPAAPAQGDTCAFKDPIGTSPFIVQANVGQFLQVGGITSVLAGSATSSLIGDSLELTYHAASSTWVCNAVVGNWIIV